MVSERISAAGPSRLETLYDLVVQIHCLCMRYRCKFIFIHVAGNRIICKGINKPFRGSVYKRVMNSKPML